MRDGTNLIALGRSKYLFDSIKYLSSHNYFFKAIITDEAYEEYGVTHVEFEQLAHDIGAAFFMTKRLYTDEIVKLIRENNIRVAISANWKYTLSKDFLDLFECGVLNFHLGNLPDYKGNATVNWSIINGEKHINGNIHKMDPVLDAGDVVAIESIPIKSDTYIADIIKKAECTVPFLYEDALQKVLASPDAYILKGTERGLRCYPRLPEDSQIDWNQHVEDVSRLIRASAHPYKGAYSFLGGKKITLWAARPFYSVDRFLAVPGHVVAINREEGTVLVACKEGLLEIQEIESENGKMIPTAYIKSIRLRFKYIENVLS